MLFYFFHTTPISWLGNHRNQGIKFLLNKAIQKNVCTCNPALSSCHACHNGMPRKVCDDCMPGVNMVCVGTCASDSILFTARLGKEYQSMLKKQFIVAFIRPMFLNNCSYTKKNINTIMLLEKRGFWESVKLVSTFQESWLSIEA